MRAALTEALREMVQYSPTPHGIDAVAAYDYADSVLADVSTIGQLVAALEDVVCYAGEPRTHLEHMVRDNAQRILKEARAAV